MHVQEDCLSMKMTTLQERNVCARRLLVHEDDDTTITRTAGTHYPSDTT